MSFAGIGKACEGASDLDVDIDVDAECDVHSPDAWVNIVQSTDPGQQTITNLSTDDPMEAMVIQNSKEVADGTDKEYRR